MKPLFRPYEGYAPGWRGVGALLLLFLAGALLGNLVALPLSRIFPSQKAMEYTQLLSYPLMFLPAMFWAARKSAEASKKTAVDVSPESFRPAFVVVCITLASAFMSDAVVGILPKMPQSLKAALEAMTNGTLWVNVLCVSVFAPFFEEWLCRGMILRGLLTKGVKPVVAIVASAAFFALIHMNPWQAVPAFILGCLFGFVYYRTGSLKLTMLMHCANNTFSLVCSRIGFLEDAETWMDVFPGGQYWIAFAACALVLILGIRDINKYQDLCW